METAGAGVDGDALAHCPSACQVVPQSGYLESAKTAKADAELFADS